MTYFLFILLGFVLGSTLFAYWIPRLFFKTDITKVPPDHNPGVANAYMQAGFFAGTLSLLCELFKGAVPVFLADRILDRDSMLFALVMAAPVFGHAFPFFQKERGGKAKAAGEKFLAENKDKEGVVTLPSGLQYKILKEGNGPKPKASDTVKCHYEGRLIDGTVFDSSIRRGEPAEFPVGGVIQGWVEALQLMPVGSKWQLYIPSEMAYGSHGAGQAIGPDETLIFDVELLAIV